MAGFNSVKILLMKTMQALNPKSDSFMDHDVIKPLLSHYNIPGKEVAVADNRANATQGQQGS